MFVTSDNAIFYTLTFGLLEDGYNRNVFAVENILHIYLN